MCGITGFIDLRGAFDEAVLQRAVKPMVESLVHRGPDDDGIFIDQDAGFGLGFRRLSIIDLSSEGHQPMHSADGRYVLAFNGEIYNFREIRAELDSVTDTRWRGTSDTEVMLAAVCHFGISETLEMLDGMFAFALWDVQEKTLHLARDRMGEKPLYYGWQGKTLLFGSELKALAAHPDWRGNLNEAALSAYMRFSYVPAPASIYRGIYKLLPGHLLTLRHGALALGRVPKARAYWHGKSLFDAAQQAPFSGTEQDAVATLEGLLSRSIERRMIADVPLGVFLSGGIDSSTVAALAQKSSSKRIRTFTIGFSDPKYNEAGFARAVAEHLGTDHTELTADENAVLRFAEKVPRVYDEPFADVSQLPTMLLSELTRKHVTTVLSGDGGDELFAGYPRYQSAIRQWQKKSRLLALLAGPLRKAVPFDGLNRIRSFRGRSARIGDKAFKSFSGANANSVEQVQLLYMSRWRTATPPISRGATGYYGVPDQWPEFGDDLARLTFADAVSYLPDDLLVKLDRASMAVSLEARAPLLNHDVVEFAWSLPSEMKLRDGVGKWLLRQVLYNHAPADLINRPKQGFEPPLADWLRGPLRDWAENLLSEENLPKDGWLDPKPIRAVWEEHVQGHRNWHFEIWNVLMFQAWRAEWKV